MTDGKASNGILDADTFDACRPILGQIAHDFNNLLTPLLAYPSLVKRYLAEDSPGLELLDAIDKASRDMIHINEQLMHLSSRGGAERTETAPGDAVEIVLEQFATVTDLSSTRITKDIDPSTPPVALSLEQFSNAFLGILNNAYECGSTDLQITVSVNTIQVSPDQLGQTPAPYAGEYVAISISDNGAGFSDEMLPTATVPFVTTKKERSQRGSGLGLSVALVVCRDHGGFLHLSNEPNGGARVTMCLPPCISAATAEAPAPDQEAEAQSSGPGGVVPRNKNRVMLVDDEATILKLFHMIISAALPDCEIDTASNGKEALDLFAEKHHAVLVMDLHMPVMDGQTAFQEICSLSERNQWEPPTVIFCTGFAPPDIVSRIVADSSNHCLLSKPVRGEVLVETIKTRLA
jgi:two-component system cell cycle sensor histidine kinase/response regulator CckA